MIIANVNPAPEKDPHVLRQLANDLDAVVERFIDANPEMPVCVMVGVLEIVKHNLIDRIPVRE